MADTNRVKSFICSKAGRAILIALFYIFFLGLLLIIVNSLDDMGYLAFIYIGLFAYFGWKSLNKIQPNIFLIMPIGGWVIYFVVKGLLSLVLGMFVAPFVFADKIVACIRCGLGGADKNE